MYSRMNAWISGSSDKWIGKCMAGSMHELASVLVNKALINGWMNAWISGGLDEWNGECMAGQMNELAAILVNKMKKRMAG